MKDWEGDYCDKCGWLAKGFLTSCTCGHKENKMTFFEAWEKADEGDGIKCHRNTIVVTKGDGGIVDEDTERRPTQRILFKKEWSIIPQKKTITIGIPEDAKNIKYHHRLDKTTAVYDQNVYKITYEI